MPWLRTSHALVLTRISPPNFRLPQLFEQQFLQIDDGAYGEEVDAALLAKLAQSLEKVLHRLLIGLHAITAEGDLLRAAAFGIHQAQVAERRGREFFGGQDLHDVHLEAASDQRGESRLIAR